MAFWRTVLWALLVLATTTGWAATRTVDNSGVCSDSTCAPCCTIQEAVSRSSGGDVISVATGTYPENVDLRYMASYGDLTLEARDGVGTVTISPTTGIALRHSVHSPNPTLANTVTIDGITTASVNDGCIWFNHTGSAVLHDVTANNCFDRGMVLDNDGAVTMERCTANGSVGGGIEIEGSTGVTLLDCTANSNANGTGFKIYSPSGSVQITNPTATDNGFEGIDAEVNGPLTITGATVTDNGRTGILAESNSTVVISSSTVTGSVSEGLKLEGHDAVNTTDSVTLTNVQSNSNDDDGVSLEYIAGPVTLTNCSFEDNGGEGLGIFDSDLDDLVITGGHATGNGDSGYNVDVDGDAVIDGAQANTNGQGGFRFRFSGTASIANCVANGNETGAGIRVFESSSNLDEVEITNCTANNNGTVQPANGFNIRKVDGPVTIEGTTTNGNFGANLRISSTAGEVLISNVVANSSHEEGIEIDVDVGPVTVENSTVDGNALEGILIRRENVDVQTVTLRENSVTNNTDTGVLLSDLSATGTFDAVCNDIAGNGDGMYHDSAVTVDASYVWWGDPSGPSGKGSGSGDSVWYEPGGGISFDPWLEESCTGCNGVVNLTLADDSVLGVESHKSCYSIDVGPNYVVYGPDGALTLTARHVTFNDGFSVNVDGALTVGNP